MISKSGFDLMQPEAKEALITRLIPLAYVITPNLPEAEVITGLKINDLASMEQAAREIYKMGAKNVLIKGGHLEDDATDLLFDGENIVTLHSDRINTKNTHGTGCTMSSCIAANLAKGKTVEEAVRIAKDYITTAIAHSLDIGKGVGPTNHFYELYTKAGIWDEIKD